MPIRRSLTALAVAAGLLLPGLLLPPAARAQDAAPKIGLELNRLEARDGGTCRVWLLLKNPAETAVDPLRLDLLVFGKDGVITRRLALDLGPLPQGKTLARIFDLEGQPCDGVGSLLMNDLLACGASAEARNACLPRLSLSSRVAGVSFDK
jgi:hypothetical protein